MHNADIVFSRRAYNCQVASNHGKILNSKPAVGRNYNIRKNATDLESEWILASTQQY